MKAIRQSWRLHEVKEKIAKNDLKQFHLKYDNDIENLQNNLINVNIY